MSDICITFVRQNIKTMAKESKYGEETKMLSFRVPKSMVLDFTQMAKIRLLEYEKLNVMNGEVENTTSIKFVKTTESSYEGDKTKRFDQDESLIFPRVSKGQWDSVIPKKIEPQVVEDVKKDKIKALQEMANIIKNSGSGVKSELFAKKKVNIDEEYEFEIVKSLPDIDSQIAIDKNGIAMYDKYDIGVFYIKWEGRYLKFDNKKEFDRFCKDNQIK